MNRYLKKNKFFMIIIREFEIRLCIDTYILSLYQLVLLYRFQFLSWVERGDDLSVSVQRSG